MVFKAIVFKNTGRSSKDSTIPWLELSKVLLLAELAGKMADSWKSGIKTFWFWTDSIIVLGWLNSHSHRLKTYVANRVSQILDLTYVSQWNHVWTEDNPADLVSRELHPCKLKNSIIQWNGPQWLEKKQKAWVPSLVQVKEDDLPERRKIKLILATELDKNLINLKSDWNQHLRWITWLSLFVDYLGNKKTMQTPRNLTVAH